MTRRDVPYPGGKCSLKCELDLIWKELQLMLRSVNGAEGDAVGNITIDGGDGIAVSTDAAHHSITISYVGGTGPVPEAVHAQTSDHTPYPGITDNPWTVTNIEV